MIFGWQPIGNTAAEMAAKNLTLRNREIGVETDTGRMKIGDGSTKWNNLKYAFDTIPTTTPTLSAGKYTLKASDASSRLRFLATAELIVPDKVIPVNEIILVAQAGANQVTIKESGAMTLRSPASKKTRTQYSQVSIYFEGETEAWLGGDLE